MKEPSEGRCRLYSPLSFYLPSPHTSLLCSSPTTWLKSAPERSLLWTEPQSSCVGRVEPACRYCCSFHFFNNVSCRRCPHVLPLCISRKMDLVLLCCLSIFIFIFRSLEFGLSSENRATALNYERKPHIVLIVWSVVSILMRWNPSCRIFCIARIVRQWEDRGAIWREFSYWMEPQQQPIGCHII